MFKAVRDRRLVRRPSHRGPWRDLDEVREAIFSAPHWSVPGREGTTLVYGQTYAAFERRAGVPGSPVRGFLLREECAEMVIGTGRSGRMRPGPSQH